MTFRRFDFVFLNVKKCPSKTQKNQTQQQQHPKLVTIPAQQQPKSGQLSGKYYRTRSLSQNLQQIFHPNRQPHSRSINNLSNVGAAGARNQSRNVLKVPHSLPQSPRVLVDPQTSPFFTSLQIPSLNFLPPAQAPTPMFNFPQFSIKIHEPTTKLKGFNLGEYRKNHYERASSIETPPLPKPFEKRMSLEERRRSLRIYEDHYQINDAVKENAELLRKYSDPKVPSLPFPESSTSSLTFLQSAFKAKLASLFKNKKKYTIAEPPSRKENSEMYSIHRCESCRSLPTITSGKKNSKPKIDKKDRKSLRMLKKTSIGRCWAEGKLKSLSLNPPQMIGGSFDNLLLLSRMNKKRAMIGLGTYDTYHGKPLLSHASRLKALYKYRKPSESDDGTALSFDYDSGDISDTSSLARSSSDLGEDSSSFSDLTTKSSNYGYKIKSSASIHSMPHMRTHRTNKTPTLSPNRSQETQLSLNTSIANRVAQHFNAPIPAKSIPYNQMSAPILNNRSDSFTMPTILQQSSSFAQYTRPNFYPTVSTPSSSAPMNQYPSQMIKAFFTSGPASSNECTLVSFLTKRIG